MINKKFDELSTAEKFQIQKIMKKKRKNEGLDSYEQSIYDRFSEEFSIREKRAKAKWPIIIFLFISSLLAILRDCQ